MDVAKILRDLLPPGPALEGKNVTKLLQGLAPALEKAYSAADEILTSNIGGHDSHPARAWETLPWVVEPKLRDDLSPRSTAYLKPFTQILQGYRGRGSSMEDFQKAAAVVGVSFTVAEYPVSMVGASVGSYLVGAEWASTFTVKLLAQPGQALELRPRYEAVMLYIDEHKPAHTFAIFESPYHGSYRGRT